MANKGHARERQVRALLEDEGWWTCRAAGSLGDADIVAAKAFVTYSGDVLARMRLIEVKANISGGPYMNFRPQDRAEMKLAAERAGAEAELCYWPAHKPIRWIPAADWPS